MVLCGLAFIFLARQALGLPVVGWDPLSFWYLKTQILWHEGSVRTADFLASDRLHFSRNYPLLVNAVEAGLCRAAGEYSEFCMKIFLLFWAAACLGVAGGFMARHRGAAAAWSACALLILLPALTDYNDTGAVSGYRDAPLALLILAAACVAMDRGNKRRRLFASGGEWLPLALLLALIVGCKREGLFWAAGLGLLAAWPSSIREGGVASSAWKIRARRWMAAFAPAAALLAVVFLLMLPWFLMSRIFPHTFSEYYAEGALRQPWGMTARRLNAVVAHLPIELFLRITRWGVLWWVFAWIALWNRPAWDASQRRLAGLVAAWGGLVAVSFLFDPWPDPTPHIAVSLDRLVLQAAPLALWLCFLNLLPPAKRLNAQRLCRDEFVPLRIVNFLAPGRKSPVQKSSDSPAAQRRRNSSMSFAEGPRPFRT